MMWYYYASSEGLQLKLLRILSAAEEAEHAISFLNNTDNQSKVKVK